MLRNNRSLTSFFKIWSYFLVVYFAMLWSLTFEICDWMDSIIFKNVIAFGLGSMSYTKKKNPGKETSK